MCGPNLHSTEWQEESRERERERERREARVFAGVPQLSQCASLVFSLPLYVVKQKRRKEKDVNRCQIKSCLSPVQPALFLSQLREKKKKKKKERERERVVATLY